MIKYVLLFVTLSLVAPSIAGNPLDTNRGIFQSGSPLQIIRSNGKDYILNKSVPIDSVIKKNWLEDVLIVKEVEATKYYKNPQSKFGVLVFVVKKARHKEVMQRIQTDALREFSK